MKHLTEIFRVKKYWNLPFLLMLCFSSIGQIANDVISVGGSSGDVVKDVEVDDKQNIYVLMRAYGDFKMNGTTLPTSITGTSRTLLLKLDSTKNLIWHKEFNYFRSSYSNVETERKHLLVDSIGNIYVTDHYSQNFDVPPFFFSSSGGVVDRVTYKLDSLGEIIWAHDGGGLMINESVNGNLELLQYNSSSGSVGGETITNELGTIVWLDTAGNYMNHLQYNTPDFLTEAVMGRNSEGNYYGFRRPLAPNVSWHSSFEYISFDSTGQILDSNLVYYGLNTYNPISIIHDSVTNTYYNIVEAHDRVPLNSNASIFENKLMLLRLDADFNVIARLDMNMAEQSNSSDLLRLSIIKGALFLTGKISIPFSDINWTSLGQSVYLYPEDDKEIIAKFTKDLNYLWHRDIPGNYFVSRINAAVLHKDNLLITGTQESFVMDNVVFNAYPSNQSDGFLLSVIDTTENYLEVDGTVFWDRDQSGTLNALDSVMAYSELGNDLFPDNNYFSNVNGKYNFHVPNEQQTIISKDLPMYWERSTNDSILINPTPQDTLLTDLDFGMYPEPGVTDLKAELTAITECVIGNHATYNLDICNVGTDTSDGTFYLVQHEYLNYLNSSITPDSIVNDTLFFSYSGLGVMECIHLSVTDSVSNDVDILGENVLISLAVNPDSIDTNYTDNSDNLLHEVTGAYDPNDITVWPSCGVTPNFVSSGQRLDYRIRFQNTGNDTASFVTIKDTLSSLLDHSSFEYKATSHPVDISIVNGVLTLQYDSINLPDSLANPEESKGFFKYSIQPKSNVQVGDSILNTAAIFFDYNPPIITNTEITSIENPNDLFSVTLNSTTCVPNGSIDYEAFCVSGGLWVSFNGDDFSFSQESKIDSLDVGIYDLQLSNGYDTLIANGLVIDYQPVSSNLSAFICSDDSLLAGGSYQTTSGVYVDTMTSIYGCDSLINTNLTVSDPLSSTDIIETCNSFTWIDGNTYTSSTETPSFMMTSSTGCDSLVKLDLTINQPSYYTDVLTSCNNYTWIDGNTYWASNNTATYTLTNAAGCDSIISLDLTISNSTSGTDTQTACDSYDWIDGNTYTTNNSSATYTLTNSAGCDSIVALDLTVLYSTSGTDLQYHCDPYTWIDGNTYTSSNNTATYTLTNAAGCDSIVSLNLTINQVSDISTSGSGVTISADNPSANYQWLDCDNNFTAINGETNQSFTAAANGNYAVELTENGCVDTSSCVAITTVGIIENDFGSELVVFPNPTEGNFNVDLGANYNSVEVSISDLNGKLIQTKEYSNSQLLNLTIDEPAGVYLLRIESDNNTAVIRLVKE